MNPQRAFDILNTGILDFFDPETNDFKNIADVSVRCIRSVKQLSTDEDGKITYLVLHDKVKALEIITSLVSS